MKLARVGKDMSQADLAKNVGVTRQTIGMIKLANLILQFSYVCIFVKLYM